MALTTPAERGMRMLIRTLLVVSAVGALDSIRRDRPVRFAGLRIAGTPTRHALTIGSPLSAPPAMLGALVLADRRGRGDVVRVLAGMFMIGILGEVDTWADLRDPRAQPIATGCAVAYLILPALIIATSVRDSSASCTTGCIPHPTPER